MFREPRIRGTPLVDHTSQGAGILITVENFLIHRILNDAREDEMEENLQGLGRFLDLLCSQLA